MQLDQSASIGVTGILPNEGNLAPVTAQTLQRQPTTPQLNELDAFFDKLNANLEKRHILAWRADYMLWLRTLLAYTGNYFLMALPGSQFGYTVVPVDPSDPVYTQNIFRFYSKDVCNQWVSSDPKIDILAIKDADDERVRATRAARAINDHYNRVHFTEVWKQINAKLAQFCGNYHAEVFFDPTMDGAKARVPEYAEGEVPGAASWNCGECGEVGEGNVEACPSCGSPMVENQSVPPTPIIQQIGERLENAGDIRCEPIPAWQLRYERGGFCQDSDWVRRSRDLPVETLQALWPEIEIKPSTPDDEGLHPDRILRRSVSAVNRGTIYGQGEGDEHYSEFVEYWYEPAMYVKAVFSQDQLLADGRTAKAGQRYTELFPKGIYRATVKGVPGSLILREESHKKRIVSSQFDLIPGRGVGDNVVDALEYAKQNNILTSIEFQSYRKCATPTLVVNSRMIRQSQLVTKPGAVVTVRSADIPEGRTVRDAYDVIPATPPAPNLVEYRGRLEAGMQKALGSLTLGAGLPGFDGGTATGVRANEEKTALSRTSELALLADFYKRISAIRLELVQQHFTDERIIHFVGKNGEMEAASFRGADVGGDFVLWVRGTSYMPNSPLVRQQNLQGAIEALTAMAAAGLNSPEALRVVNEIFDVEISDDTIATYADWCRKAINDMKAQSAQVEQSLPQIVEAAAMMDIQQQAQYQMLAQAHAENQPVENPNDPTSAPLAPPEPPQPIDPMQMAGQILGQVVRVDPYELGAIQKIYWFRDWLSGDEGQKASEIERNAVHGIIDRLGQGMIEEAQRKMALQMASQPPQPEPDSDEGAPPKKGAQQSQVKEKQGRDKQLNNQRPARPQPPKQPQAMAA